MNPKHANSSQGDDADVRGEHDYRSTRARRITPSEPIAEELLKQRQPGHYVAGAEGTQDVVEPPEPRDRTDEEKP